MAVIPWFRLACRPRGALRRLLHALLWLLPLGVSFDVAAEAVLVDGRPALALWPSVTLLRDPAATLDLAAVLAQTDNFQAPSGTPGNLGRTTDAVWLRVPLHVPGVQPQRRVLELDFPPLNHVDSYLLQGGQVLEHQRMGNALRLAERPLPTRSHAVAYTLPPGDSVLLVRVQTLSAMVLPLTLRSPENFTTHESEGQILQGLMTGLALCMLIYSLAHWISLRDRSFVDYALMLGGNLVFTLTYFGIGGLYLWPEWPQLSMQLAPMAVLLAVAGGTGFMRAVLNVRRVSRGLDLMLRAVGIAAIAVLALGLCGALDYRLLQTLATVLGLVATMAVLPAACVQAYRRELVALYMLAGWSFYVCGAVTTACMVNGLVEPTFWMQYLYPLSMLAEMSTWMAVLSLRVQNIHRNADRTRIESEALRALAHTDALTGLLNRRGLQEQLAQALRAAGTQRQLAVYLIDLDGFKPVNDRHGHDVGDALLVAAGRRLQMPLRQGDAVARVGGDEFVVLACGVDGDKAARALGDKLLAAFKAPFDALGHRCSVGLTIGYALAPHDGASAEALLKRSDEAMYSGKQAGGGRVQRAGVPALPSTAAIA